MKGGIISIVYQLINMKFPKKLSCILIFSCFAITAGLAQDKKTEDKIEALLSKMTLKEKIGQMNQINGRNPSEELYRQIRSGEVGSMLNVENPELVNKLQKIAKEEYRLGIPLVIARDVIHGFKTMFPIPLGQAASFDPEIIETGAQIAAREASEKGIRWTFQEMHAEEESQKVLGKILICQKLWQEPWLKAFREMIFLTPPLLRPVPNTLLLMLQQKGT